MGDISCQTPFESTRSYYAVATPKNAVRGQMIKRKVYAMHGQVETHQKIGMDQFLQLMADRSANDELLMRNYDHDKVRLTYFY